MPTNKRRFEVIILGCSGGPISGKTCSFLLKPADVETVDIIQSDEDNGCLLALDAGSGLSNILDILDSKDKCTSFQLSNASYLLDLYPVSDSDNGNNGDAYRISDYLNLENMLLRIPFQSADSKSLNKSNYQIADLLLNKINGYLITHSHLDHVCSLVINSPGFTKKKEVYGLESTIEPIRKDLFNNSIWPDLVSMGIISLNYLEHNQPSRMISPRYEVTAFRLSHGKLCQDNRRFISSAFLITDLKYDYSMLFFGDVESDLCSGIDYNLFVWGKIAPLIRDDKFNTIFIECSTVDKPGPLYGHLTPSNLIYELLNLRKSIVCLDNTSISNLSYDDPYFQHLKVQPLRGLNVIIIHVKETTDNVNPRTLILEEVEILNKTHHLQINFSIGLSGISLLL